MLRAKFRVPAINPKIISRKKLLEKLQLAQERKLTLLMAPAGYGKTTAVLDWLEKCEIPAAWISLNSYNNAPLAFWRYFCVVMDDTVPGISRDTEHILSSPELLGANIHINMLVDTLSGLESDLALVLDDVHLITDSSILKGISYFIDYMPAKMHLILVSRTEPDLELARHRIKWQMQTIDEKDLQFQKEDIFRFYQARGFLFETDEIEKLEKYTEGWIASLVAIAMRMEEYGQYRITPDSLPLFSRDIGQYLKNEVISGWSDEKRIFAMKTSILDTMSEEVCDAVTGDKNGRRMLAEIYRAAGFLTALDGQGSEYKYHYLFKDFLYKLLLETEPAQVFGLHARAGTWYRGQGMLEKAVEHFQSSGLYKDILELIENHDVQYMYDSGTLISWIERLPKPLRDESFKTAYIYAKYYAEIERFDLVRVWVERMKALAALPKYAADTKSAASCRIACALNETNLLLLEGNPGFAMPLMSVFESFDARYYKMPEYIDFNTSGIYFYRCPSHMLLQLYGRNKDKFREFAENYRALIKRHPGYKPLVAGEYLYESNRLDEALPYLLDAMEEAQAASCFGALVPAMVGLARIKRAKGDFRGALQDLDECGKRLQGAGKIHWSYLVSAFRCRLYMDLNEAEKVERWFLSCKLDVYMEINKIREFELMVYSRVLLFKNSLQAADILLQRLLIFTEKKNRPPHSRVEVLNLLAILHYRTGEPSKAVLYLDQALSIGSEQSYTRSFLDEGEAMKTLLSVYIKSQECLTDQKNADFAAALLEQMRKIHESEYSRHIILKTLSAREREVLTLLLEAYSNREISEQMGITLQAVKFHIGNIYSKLGVKNRAQCLVLARESSVKRD